MRNEGERMKVVIRKTENERENETEKNLERVKKKESEEK